MMMECLNDRGFMLKTNGRIDEAIACYQEGLKIKEHPFLHHGLSDCFYILGQYDKSMIEIQKALEIDPHIPELSNQLGIIQAALKRFHEAEKSFQMAIHLKNKREKIDFPEAKFHLSYLYLSCGRFEEGFSLYENRLKRKNKETPGFTKKISPWKGQSGNKILVYGEQGIGDLILFSRFLKKINFEKIYLSCDPRLAKILQRIDPEKIRIYQGENNIDYQTQIGSLPHYLMKNHANLMNEETVHQPNLTPDLGLSLYFKEKYDALFKSNLKIGVAVNSFNVREKFKKNGTLNYFKTLANEHADGKSWILLDEVSEMDGFYQDREFNPYQNIEILLAQMSALDLVIGIDNSVSNLAAGMGQPTWVILPYAADWRWMESGEGIQQDPEKTPWYPTARLFRSPGSQDWEYVFQKIGKEL